MADQVIYFQPSDYSAPPFSFSADLAEGTFEINIYWRTYINRWYLEVQANGGQPVLVTPLVGSSDHNNINLIRRISASTLIFRSSSNSFEITQ